MNCGKLGSVTTGDSNSTGGVCGRVSSLGMGLDKFLEVSRGDAQGDPRSGTRRYPVGVAKVNSWIVWILIAGGLTCVGCSSVLCSF